MKRAVIFANGNLSNVQKAKEFVQADDFVVGVDGGAIHALNVGVLPHAVIGDMDSLIPSLREKLSRRKIEWIKYPVRKNETDFELALQLVLKRKYRKIVIYGILGDRLDHLLVNIYLLKSVVSRHKNIKIMVIEGRQKAYFVRREINISGQKGDLVSILSLTNSLEGVTTRGLEYQLDNAVLSSNSSRGVSNVLTGSSATITISKGIALIVHQT